MCGPDTMLSFTGGLGSGINGSDGQCMLDVSDKAREARLRWFGHVQRGDKKYMD